MKTNSLPIQGIPAINYPSASCPVTAGDATMSHVIEFWTERDYSHVVRDAGALSVTVTPPYAIGQLSAMNDWRQAFLSCQFKLPPLRLSASQGLGRLFERSCVRLGACYKA